MRLFEALVKDETMKGTLDKIVARAEKNPYYQKVMKEALYSDMVNAVAGMHDIVIEAAKPALIGREAIWVVSTKEAIIRFPKVAKLAVAKKTAEGASY